MNYTDKSEFIRQNGFYVTTPQGGSMWPFIRGGIDTVAVVSADGGIRKYDVIHYKAASGADVMHRVIGRKNGAFLVRGDNCFYKETVAPESIYGVADRVFRKGKKSRRFRGAYLIPVVLWRYAYPLRAFLFHLRNGLLRIARKNKK